MHDSSIKSQGMSNDPQLSQLIVAATAHLRWALNLWAPVGHTPPKKIDMVGNSAERASRLRLVSCCLVSNHMNWVFY